MANDLLEKYTSKATCRYCGEHKITTNYDEKNDAVLYYHCLACNRQYSDTQTAKELAKKKKDKSNQSDESAGVVGLLLLVSLIMVIFVVFAQRSDNTPSDLSANRPVEQLDERF